MFQIFKTFFMSLAWVMVAFVVAILADVTKNFDTITVFSVIEHFLKDQHHIILAFLILVDNYIETNLELKKENDAAKKLFNGVYFNILQVLTFIAAMLTIYLLTLKANNYQGFNSHIHTWGSTYFLVIMLSILYYRFYTYIKAPIDKQTHH